MPWRSLSTLLLAAGCAAPRPPGAPTPEPPAPSGEARPTPARAASSAPRAAGIAPTPAASSAPGAGAREIYNLPLSGPFTSRQQACEAIALEEVCAGSEVQKKIAGAPYLTVEIVALWAKRRPDFRRYGLFVELQRGWFSLELGAQGTQTLEIWPPDAGPPSLARRTYSYEVPALSRFDLLPGGAPEILLAYPTVDKEILDAAPRTKRFQVCGLGPSGDVSCTAMLYLIFLETMYPATLIGPGGEVNAMDADGVFREQVIRFP